MLLYVLNTAFMTGVQLAGAALALACSGSRRLVTKIGPELHPSVTCRSASNAYYLWRARGSRTIG